MAAVMIMAAAAAVVIMVAEVRMARSSIFP